MTPTKILANWMRRNSTEILGAHLTRRSFGLRAKISADVCPNSHPESRRTIPEVYVAKNRPKNQDGRRYQYKLEPKIDVNERRRVIKKYSRALQRHPSHGDFQCFTNQYRWAEFRRKLIYGKYEM